MTLRILSLTLLLGFASSLIAQRGDRNMSMEDRAKQQTEQMTDSLGLSEKQAEKVGEINLKWAQKFTEARANAGEGADWSGVSAEERVEATLTGMMLSPSFLLNQ